MWLKTLGVFQKLIKKVKQASRIHYLFSYTAREVIYERVSLCQQAFLLKWIIRHWTDFIQSHPVNLNNIHLNILVIQNSAWKYMIRDDEL